MEQQDPQSAMQIVTKMLEPWHASLANPAKTQEAVLQKLLAVYSQTAYGQKYEAGKVGSLADYRAKFPVAT